MLAAKFSITSELDVTDFPDATSTNFNELLVFIEKKLAERFEWEADMNEADLPKKLLSGIEAASKEDIEETWQALYDRMVSIEWVLEQFHKKESLEDFRATISKTKINEFFKLIWQVKFEVLEFCN
jgi:hypothetical protein